VKVQEVMTSPVHTARAEESVACAARKMEEHACGVLPVVDEQQRPIGMITGRDIAMAVARTSRSAEDLRVREAMTSSPFVCGVRDDLEWAVDTMALHRVRRLPVVEPLGRLVGIVSFRDVVAATRPRRRTDDPADRLVPREKAREDTGARSIAGPRRLY
jgi:CBS domain-containing protein